MLCQSHLLWNFMAKNDSYSSSNFQNSWKRRPSEIRGYHRTLYLTTDDNDYLRVDYNLKEKLVRLYIEIAEEGGNSYYSVIRNGKITAEKSVVSGRSFGFADKFRERADIFSTIPNTEVIKLINSNYTIASPVKRKVASTEKKKMLEETRKKYFQPVDKTRRKSNENIGLSLNELRFIDFIDVLFGIVISYGIFALLQYDYIALGVVAAFYGISIGLIDMAFRGRPPIIIKMVLFIFAGVSIYIYGYFFP